jgi:hemerythrin-like metal-binding protein
MALDIPFERIAWSDRMVTGIAQVDAQHRYLVDTLSDANVKLLVDRDGALLADIAKGLLNYAIMHFETEEDLMRRYGYVAAHPDVARAHIAQHRQFSRQVVAVCDQLREKRPISNVEVLKYLNEWLRNHVLGIDQKLGAFVREAKAKEGN